MEKQISLKLSLELYETLEKIAKSKEISVSALMRMVLKEYTDKDKEPK